MFQCQYVRKIRNFSGIIRPVPDCVESPARQPFTGQAEMEVPPVRAVFAQQVRGGEIVGEMLSAIAFRIVEESGARSSGFGKSGEKTFSPFHQRSIGFRTDAVDAVRPEQITFGVRQIPFAVVLLRVEGAGSLETRPFAPAAEFGKGGGAAVGCEIVFFSFPRQLQLLIRLHLAGPLFVDVLAVAVDEREEPFRGGRIKGRHRRV